MVLFRTHIYRAGNVQNNTSKPTRLHQSFKFFCGEHVPEPTSISVADITIFLYMKVAIFYSEFPKFSQGTSICP